MVRMNFIVYISENADEIVEFAAKSFAEITKKVLSVPVETKKAKNFSCVTNGFVFSTFEELNAISGLFERENAACNGDGFCVTKKENVIFVLSHLSRGVYYGVHELLERNLPVVFSRGAKEESLQYQTTDDYDFSESEFVQNCPFTARSWNLCGIGSEGQGHLDDGTAEWLARNKSNATFHSIDEKWRKYGLFHNGKRVRQVQVFDEMMEAHPEYFMTDSDGKPKKAFGGYESFPNYYNQEVAEFLAERLVSGMENANHEDTFHWTMPDNAYFYMIENGKRLHELPFTCDDGTVVYPKDGNYKSTVYFNFLNRLIRAANKL